LKTKSQHFPSKKKGQAITEFLIALPVLLLMLFGIIEFGRLVFSWMAVQNAARFGLRYAVTGGFDESYCDEAAAALGGDYSTADMADGVSNCRVPDSYGDDADDMEIGLVDWARLPSIRDAAQAGGAGLFIDGGVIGNYLSYLVSHNTDDIGEPEIKGYYHVTVCSTQLENPPYEFDESNYDIPLCVNQEDPDNKYLMDNAGTPGARVRIVITYRHNMLLPLISTIWPDVPLDGRREGLVENYRNARIISAVGGFTPAATWTATGIPSSTPTSTNTSTATDVPSATPTATATNTVFPVCADLSLNSFEVKDKEFKFKVNNAAGGSINLSAIAFDWAIYAASAPANQYVEKIEIGGGMDKVTINPSPNDVSPITESTNIDIPSGDTDFKFKFMEGGVDAASVVGDYGVLLSFTPGGSTCLLAQPSTNEPPPTPTFTPTGPTPTTGPSPTATQASIYSIVPGPDGEIWYRVDTGAGFDSEAWVHVTWHTNPDGSVTTRTTFSESFVDNSYASLACGDGMGMGMDVPTATPTGLVCEDNSIGWGDDPHTWRELWHSDHVQIDFKGLDGSTIFAGKFDYVEEDGSNGCVTDGDGEVQTGDAGDIVSCDSSMTQNAQLACYDPTGPSPKADENYTQDPTDPSYCPGWQYSVWYETTISGDAFDDFGYPLITYIHASPAKGEDDKPDVVPGPTVAPTNTITNTPTNTPDWTKTPTNSPVPTETPSFTPSPTQTNTPVETPGCPPDDPRYPDC